jgi:Predicted amidohydrolase
MIYIKQGMMYMNILNVALIQHKAVANDITSNLELGLQYIRKAKDLGADIVLFPELWSNGYSEPYKGAFLNPFDERYEKERMDWLNDAIDEESDYVHAFQNVAREFQIGIVITYLSKGRSAPQNVALVIDKTGDILMKLRFYVSTL